MVGNDKIVSVILAAGKGTRMRAPYLHKVCFPLDGKPVISRAIEGYHRCGVDSHFLVVGPMAEQVMQAASMAPGSHFYCHQSEQLGTGSAAKCAAKLLEAMDYQGSVLVVAGDKVIEDDILLRLIDEFNQSKCDMALLVGDIGDYPDSGRIIQDSDGNILGNVEVFDISRMQLLLALRSITCERVVSPQEAENLTMSYFKSEKKAALALGSLWESIKTGNPVTQEQMLRDFTESDYALKVNSRGLPPELLANSTHANISVYLYRARAFYDSLRNLGSDNAQQEEYLTDTIGIVAENGNARIVPVDYPEQVMAFNTPQELKAIEDYISSRKRVSVGEAAKNVRKVSEWVKAFEDTEGESSRFLGSTYGDDYSLVEAKRRFLVSVLNSYGHQYGDEPVTIARAPGRVNIMGRHIDHQGGHVNQVAIDRDFYLVVGAREDRAVKLHNVESHQLPDRTFDIDEIMADYHGGEWLDFVNSDPVRARATVAQGDWSQYVIAPIARLQAKYPGKSLAGMNIAAGGNVPIAAGLSSSSAVVVSTAEAIISLNRLDVTPEQFVELCGEGEWYVGTRGGAADHAAMKFASSGRVVQFGFFPFGPTDNVPFPDDYLFVLCNSHEKARKTVGAKDVFNHRVACYNIGREMFKLIFPKHASSIEHLRDINARHLGVSNIELLEMLKALPSEMSRNQVLETISRDKAERYLMSHSDTYQSYPIRSVVIYGLAEAQRSSGCAELLRTGRVEEFGRWMNISHDGDRVVRWDSKGNSWPCVTDYSDSAMGKLISDAQAGDPCAELANQPGAYGCSIPQIDRIVDISLGVKNVLGAQILGAGLGGCALVLVHKDSYDDLEKAVIKEYYDKRGLEPDIFACRPVAGSCIVRF